MTNTTCFDYSSALEWTLRAKKYKRQWKTKTGRRGNQKCGEIKTCSLKAKLTLAILPQPRSPVQMKWWRKKTIKQMTNINWVTTHGVISPWRCTWSLLSVMSVPHSVCSASERKKEAACGSRTQPRAKPRPQEPAQAYARTDQASTYVHDVYPGNRI